MKYLMCLLAVIGELFAYLPVGANLFGWRRVGGVVPQTLLYVTMAAICRAICRDYNEKKYEKERSV